MKTLREHFEGFPEPYRSQAIENTLIHNHCYADLDQDTKIPALQALPGAFIWRNTPEGHHYWSEFYETL